MPCFTLTTQWDEGAECSPSIPESRTLMNSPWRSQRRAICSQRQGSHRGPEGTHGCGGGGRGTAWTTLRSPEDSHHTAAGSKNRNIHVLCGPNTFPTTTPLPASSARDTLAAELALTKEVKALTAQCWNLQTEKKHRHLQRDRLRSRRQLFYVGWCHECAQQATNLPVRQM